MVCDSLEETQRKARTFIEHMAGAAQSQGKNTPELRARYLRSRNVPTVFIGRMLELYAAIDAWVAEPRGDNDDA
jgi:hypothetical protein